MNDYTLTEIAVAFFAVLGLFGFGVWTFARAWLALDRRRHRIKPPPPPEPFDRCWNEEEIARAVRDFDRQQAEVNG